ncbi:MAG: hypothetical protein K8I27_07055 [Planctomycetes bacterium]|nr:hypothetical protein [Planctomycetota bacterium]
MTNAPAVPQLEPQHDRRSPLVVNREAQRKLQTPPPSVDGGCVEWKCIDILRVCRRLVMVDHRSLGPFTACVRGYWGETEAKFFSGAQVPLPGRHPFVRGYSVANVLGLPDVDQLPDGDAASSRAGGLGVCTGVHAVDTGLRGNSGLVDRPPVTFKLEVVPLPEILVSLIE